MNKNELIDRVTERTGLRKKDVSLVTAAVFGCIADALAQEEKVTIAGFGVMELRHRAARKGQLPIDQRDVDIPVVRPANQLKEKVNA